MYRISNEHFISMILDNGDVGIWTIEVVEGEKPRFYGNDAMIRLLGIEGEMTPEDLYERWYNNIDPLCYDKVNNAVEEIMRKNRVEIEYSWNHPTKGRTYVRCGGIIDETFLEGIRMSGYHQDVTKQVITSREKEWLEELNSNIINSLENLYDGIYRVDIETGRLMVIKGILSNERKGKFYSYEEYIKVIENLFSKEEFEKIKEKVSIAKMLELSKNKCKKIRSECYIEDGSGMRKWYSYTVFFDEKYLNNRFVIIAVENITEQKGKEDKEKEMIEEAYALAKKANLAKSMFLSRMSHDIRTPLNAILGMTRIAKSNLENISKVEECLNRIETAGDVLLNLVNQVLDMGKIENEQYDEKFQEIDIVGFVEKLVRLYRDTADKKKIDLDFNSELEDNFVKCDVIAVQRILSNIVSNAIKYGRENGYVQVKLRELDKFYENRVCYEFRVEDNGIGMSKEFMKKLYEPFCRGENPEVKNIGGNGLGMSIVYNLVKRLNGSIKVESELGKGTVITIILEFEILNSINNSEVEEKEDISIKSINLKNKKILLVEDNEINREIAEELIGITGAEVVSAENGEEAVKIIENSQIDEYSLVFMDIQMPIMDGYTAVKLIRNMQREDIKRLPIVAMSANTFNSDIQRSIEAGMNQHLSKPIDLKKLAEVLKDIEKK